MVVLCGIECEFRDGSEGVGGGDVDRGEGGGEVRVSGEEGEVED